MGAATKPVPPTGEQAPQPAVVEPPAVSPPVPPQPPAFISAMPSSQPAPGSVIYPVPPQPPAFISAIPATFLRASLSHYHPHLHASDQPVPGTAMVTLTGDGNARHFCRAPLHISAVVDTSGSMNLEGKLDSVKAALHFIVSNLQSGDALNITTFDENAQSITGGGMTSVSPGWEGSMRQAIKKMKASGGTNLSGGIENGLRSMMKTVPMHRYGPTKAAAAGSAGTSGMPPVPAHLLAHLAGMSHSRPCGPATAAAPQAAKPAGASATVPRFYVGLQRLQCASDTTQLISVQATLPPYVDCIELAANGVRCEWRNDAGMPPSVPLPLGTIGVTVVFRSASYTAESHVVNLPAEGAEKFITVAPQPATPKPVAVVPPPPPQAAPVQLILVFTDGEANRGISDANTLSRTVAGWMQLYAPEASLVTFGFGYEHNATLLRTLATATEGTYYHVANAAQIPQLFGDCLGGFTSVAARRVSLKIKSANPDVTITSIRTSYPQMPDGSIRFRNIFGDERRDVVFTYQVSPRAVTAPTPFLPLFEIETTHRLPNLTVAPPLSLLGVLPVEARPYTGVPDSSIDDQLSRLDVARVMEEATTLAGRGDFGRARVLIDEARQRSRAVKTAFTHCLAAELDEMETVMEPARWASGGCAISNAMQVGHAQQRCNRPAAAAAGYYQTQAKSSMAAQASAFATSNSSPTS